MKVKQLQALTVAMVLALTAIACEHPADPVGPVDAQYAKGGKGKPNASTPVELLEYYIYQDGPNSNQVHILATGNFPMVNLNVVQDYIFNGIRDDNYSIYYEYTTAAPAPVPVDKNLALDDETGAWHIDIPWNGETWWRDYTIPESPVRVDVQFPDFPHVGLNGGTADPYAFDVRFQKENGDYVGGFQPQGIVLDGANTNLSSKAMNPRLHPGDRTVYSYATHESSRPGEPVFIAQMSLDPSSLSCKVRTVSEGRGKNRTSTKVTEVSGIGYVVLSDLNGSLPDAWIDVMLATGDPNNPDLADSFSTTHGAESWANGWGVSAQFAGVLNSIDVMLAVSYVYATDLQSGTVYDPSLNDGGSAWQTINAYVTEPGRWPISVTTPVTLNCGG